MVYKQKEKSSVPQTITSLVKKSSALSLLTLISRILGLLREMTKASFLGTTALSDAFSVAYLLPNLFRRLFAEGSIAVAFIPTYKEHLLENNREKTREFLSCIFTFLIFFVTLMVTAGILGAPLLVKLFGVQEFDKTVLFTRIMFPFLGFISLAALFQGVLNSHHIFTPSGLAPILLNIVIISGTFLLSRYTATPPAHAMSICVLIGGVLSMAIQLPFVLKQGQSFFFTSLKHAINNPGTRKVLRLISPTIIGMAAYQINDLISTALGARAGEGVVSSLQYSLRLQELILGVFAVSIGTVLLPNLAEYAKTSQWEAFNKRLLSSMNIIALITIPITFFSLSEGQSLIRFLFQNRTFDESSVQLTLSAFTFHMLGMFFIALNRILAPAFYAQSDTKSPTIAGIISMAANIILATILVGPMQGAGIALALSLASIVNTIILLVFLNKKPNITMFSNSTSKIISSVPIYTFKIIIIAGLAILPIHFLSPSLQAYFANRGRFISYGLPLGINMLFYSLIGIVLLATTKDKYFFTLLNIFKKRNK